MQGKVDSRCGDLLQNQQKNIKMQFLPIFISIEIYN